MINIFILLGLSGYAHAAPSIITSPVAYVEDGIGGFEELGSPKGIDTVTVGPSTYAIVAAYGDNGVQIIDITDPSNPRPAASISDGESGFEEIGGARYVTTAAIGSSTYALVSASDDDGIQIINITDPYNPTPVAHMSDAAGIILGDPRGIAIFTIDSSTYAIVASHSSGFQILNITDPSSHVPAGSDVPYVVSRHMPALESIVRAGGTSQDTASQSLAFEVRFSEPVTGVDAGDFALSSDLSEGPAKFTYTSTPSLAIPSGTAIHDTITVPHPGRVSHVSIGVDITHPSIDTLKVDLISPDGTVAVLHDREGLGKRDIHKTYEQDFAGVEAAGGWTLRVHDNDISTGTLDGWVLTATYDDVPGAVTGLEGDGREYRVEASAGLDGTYGLELAPHSGITDLAGNPLSGHAPTGESQSYAVLTGPPSLESITRSAGAARTAAGGPLYFDVAFSERVTGVDAGDFAAVSGNAALPGRFSYTAAPQLAIPDSGEPVYDVIAVPVHGSVTAVSVDLDITHTYESDLKVDLVAPDGTIASLHDRVVLLTHNVVGTYAPDLAGVEAAGDWMLRLSDYAPEDTGVLNSWTLEIEYDGAAGAVTGLEGDGREYRVEVSAEMDGTYGLELAPHSGITDLAGSPLSGHAPTGESQSYALLTGPPYLESITRSAGAARTAAGGPLYFDVAFSERVAGVDAGDFVLSPDDIRESKRFVHTKTPSLPIPDNGAAVSDAITVSGSGAVRTMSVYVDISHVYTDDLSVHLVAPDGTLKTLHSRTVFFCDRYDLDFFDICGTYEPDFFGASVTGDWLLRVSDHEQGYSGTLNEWVLDIEYDNPPSAVTGSGSRYTVTLEAASDGIYSVGLAPNNGIADMTGNPLDGTGPVGEDQSYTVDSAAPAIVSIERSDPAGQSAAAGRLPFHVTFSELVTGVNRGDFVLSPESPETGKVVGLTDSHRTYIMETGRSDDPSSPAQRIPLASQFIVTVEAMSGGTYNLDVAAESGIADMTGNPLNGTTPTGADQSYMVKSALSVDAGDDQTVREGSAVTLDGTVTYSGSWPTYRWTHDSNLDITIANATALSPSFTAPAVAADATVTFTLTADDGTHASSDSVRVLIAAEPNLSPALEAIPARQVDELSVMAFTAVATDADLPADTLAYRLEGAAPAGAAMDPATGEFTWTPAEHQDGVHAFTVTVSDGRGGTDSQGVQVTVNEVNSPPAADAGADQTVMEGSSVTLAGTAADDDGDAMTYAWIHGSALEIAFNDTSPTAVTLAGTAADDDGDAMTYAWIHGSALEIAFNDTSPTAAFEAPEVDEDTVLSFTLAVSDGAANSTDTVEITVRDGPDGSDFVTTWETGGPGESVTIPARGTYAVDWGDGTADAGVSGIQTHAYDAAGNHTVRISKGITGFHLDGHPDAGKLMSVDQWGDAEWASMRYSFKGASNMILHAADVPDLSRVTNMKHMFKNARSFDGDVGRRHGRRRRQRNSDPRVRRRREPHGAHIKRHHRVPPRWPPGRRQADVSGPVGRRGVGVDALLLQGRLKHDPARCRRTGPLARHEHETHV